MSTPISALNIYKKWEEAGLWEVLGRYRLRMLAHWFVACDRFNVEMVHIEGSLVKNCTERRMREFMVESPDLAYRGGMFHQYCNHIKNDSFKIVSHDVLQDGDHRSLQYALAMLKRCNPVGGLPYVHDE